MFHTKYNTLLFGLGFYEAFKETDYLFSTELSVEVGILRAPDILHENSRIHLLIDPWVSVSLSDFLGRHEEIAIHHVTLGN